MVRINKVHIKKTVLKSLSLTIVLFVSNIHADAVNLNFSTSTVNSGNFTVVYTTANIINIGDVNINFINPVERVQVTPVLHSSFFPDVVPKVLLPDRESLKAKLLNGEIKVDVDKIVITSFLNQTEFTQTINSGGVEHSTKVTFNDDGSFLLEPKKTSNTQ